LTDPDRSHENQQPSINDDEIDIREAFRVLWAGKWLISGITFSVAVVAVIVALMLPNIYQAEALLAPRKSEGAAGLSALASQYGGLASLVGINLADGSTDKSALGLEVLKSRKFISNFIEQHDLLVPLMAAKGWNRETGELEIDPDLYDVSDKKWVREARPPRKRIPSLQEAYKEFSGEVFSVSQDEQTGFVIISVQHYSPDVAKKWVDWLVEDINATIMLQDVDEAEQAIEYLNQQIEMTVFVDLKNVFFRLIEEQTKTVMLAEVSSEYFLKTLDPAVVPEEKAKPKRAMIVLITACLSGILVMFLVLVTGSRKVSQ
jgi:uncharacterized protein involved in exopolysaccharide biosynthesis